MRPRHGRVVRCSALFGIALAATGTLLAAPSRMAEVMERARAEARSRPARIVKAGDAPAPEFGTNATSVVNVNAYEFQGANAPGDNFFDDGNGYRYLTAASSGFIAAPLRLPSGVTVLEMSVNLCAPGTGTLTAAIVDAHSVGDPIESLGSIVAGSSGCSEQFQALGFDYDQNQYHPLNIVIHWDGPMDGSLKFNNVSVSYRLRVSPAPDAATFADVPTGHPFFQFVEALAASGITAGCGNGNFCPDQPLTRGQMAVFLSKALGLHWPN